MPASSIASLGLSNQQTEKVGYARTCKWRYEGETISDSYLVMLSIFDYLAMEDVVGTNIKPVPKIGRHDAVTYTPPYDVGCALSIAVAEKTRVDTMTVGGDGEKGCQLMRQVAELAEPYLP